MIHSKIVIKTKLVIPRVKESTLCRARLLEQLKKNIRKKLVLICGDAGYGKTTLLAQLCAVLSSPYLYVALSPSDNDLTTFFYYIINGIRQTYAHFGDMTESILEQTQDHKIIVGTFINEFFGLIRDDFFLLLDDFHALQDNQKIIQAFQYLLQHQPENLHIIITTRKTPPFNLSFYLTKQELFKIDTDVLQFDREEIRMLLDEIHHMSIPEQEIDRVMTHSQGWITAVQLILQKIAISGEHQAKETLNGYIASGEELFDYFAREVFEHQTEKIQNFMLQTSFMQPISSKVCNSILNIRTGSAMLKRLEREHTFISQTSPGIYMYHPLFRAFIMNRAREQFSHSKIRTLHATIGTYYAGQNNYEAAVDTYIQGSLYKRATTIIKKISNMYIQSCRFNRLLHWFELLPAAVVQQDTTLQNIKASVLWHTLHIDEALTIFERCIQQVKRKKDKKNLLTAHYGTARIYTNQGNFTKAMELLKRCLVIPGISKILLVDIYNLLGVCHVYVNEFEKAEDMFEKAAQILERHGGFERNASLMNNLAIVAFTKGELERSVRMFRKLVKTHANPLAEAHIYANIALALIDLGRLEKARQALADSFFSSRRFVNARAFHQFMLGLGFYYLETYDYMKAERYFSKILSISEESQEHLSEQKARHGLLKTYYLARDTVSAQTVLKEVLAKDVLIPGVRNHDAFLLKGLIELQAGEFQKAEKTLLQALSMVQRSEFKYSLMKNLYHGAYLYWKKGETPRMREYLHNALCMAGEYGYDYFLVRQVRFSPILLEYAEEHAIQSGYAKKILHHTIKTSLITITLFHSFEVSIFGQQINASDWQTRKSQVMFAYIMLHRKRLIAKDVLINTFSIQDKPAQADQDIRTTISRIQRVLPFKNIIQYKRGFYRVFPGLNVKIDVEEFERLCTQLIKPSPFLDPRMITQIYQACALYRGDFLVGFYDQWSDATRHHYKEQFLRLLTILANCLQKRNDHEQALKTYWQIIDTDPLNEKGHRGVLHMLQALERVKDATEHYRQFKETMRRETGINLPHTLAEYLSSI